MSIALRLDSALGALPFRGRRALHARRTTWIQPFGALIGDGTLHVHGRVLAGREPFHDGSGILARLRTMWARWETDEVPGVEVRARSCGAEGSARTDAEGYFALRMPLGPTGAVSPFTEVELTVDGGPRRTVQASVPGGDARFVVVSDVDDTALIAHATNRLRQFHNLYVLEASERAPVPGMAPLYRALALGGRDAPEHNPIAYVSSCPANVLGVVRSALALNGFPGGPLYLPDVGFDDDKLIKDGHLEHKADAIGEVLDAWPHLGAILFGDTGQADPEVFEHVAERHPGRVRGVFLRDAPGGKPAPADEVVERLRARGIRAARFARADLLRDELATLGWVRPSGPARPSP